MSKASKTNAVLNGLKIAAAAILFQTVVATTPATASQIDVAETAQTIQVTG
jgi:hypothetical protein